MKVFYAAFMHLRFGLVGIGKNPPNPPNPPNHHNTYHAQIKKHLSQAPAKPQPSPSQAPAKPQPSPSQAKLSK